MYAIIYDGEKLIIVFNYKDEHKKETLPEVEVTQLMELAEQKGVVVDKTTLFFIPDHFGVVKEIPKT